MKVKKMLLREETEKVLHTKSNGDKLVVAASGDGYTAFTKDNVRIGHISAETDAAAIAEFSKKEPNYESMNKENKRLQESASFDELTDFFNWIQDYKDGALYDEFSAEFESVDDRDLDMDSILTWLKSFDEEAYYDYIDKNESLNEANFDTAEYRIQRYEDDIPELFHRVHDGYMKGMVNAKAYADVLAKIYSVLEELDYVDESLKESYMDTHEGVAHVDTLDLMAALKSVVKEYGHMELVTPLYCELHDDEHGRRLELNRAVDENMIPGMPDMSMPMLSMPEKIGGDININLDGSHSSVGFLGGTATNTNNGEEGDHDASNSHNEDRNAAVNKSGLAQKELTNKKDVEEAIDDDFMDAEKMDMSEFDSHQGKLEDIEFVMTEYIADSMLIEFVKKVDATTWLVGVEDEVVTVKFDPSWSEYVYTIEGRGPYSHSSYEYISRDVYDFVMSQRTGDEHDDDFDDLSSFNECSDVKRADALYGVEREDPLTEGYYEWKDTTGCLGEVGEIYTTSDLRRIWEDGKYSDPSMAEYKGDYNAWVKDTLAQMEKQEPDVDEAFDMSHGPDLGKLSWQVASYLDVDALGEDKWIEFICDDPRDTTGGKKSMRFEAIGEDAHMYGFIRTNGDAVDVQFRNGSEAVCHSAEEVARFIAGEFGISI